MKELITRKELFETIHYVVNKIEKGEHNLSIEIKHNFVRIIETKSISEKELFIDEFVYEKVENDCFTEKVNFDVKI